MKRIIITKKSFILFVLLILTGIILMGIPVKPQNFAEAAGIIQENPARLIRVQGAGEVVIEPDIAFVNFGVETTKAELTAAQNENSRIMASVIKALKQLEINEDDIQTSNYSINPRYEYYNGFSKKTGYHVNNTIRVKLKDLERAGKLIDTVTAAGANIFHGIEFSMADKSEYYNSALQKALNSANEKARLIAASQGVELGFLISVIEQGINEYNSYTREARIMASSDSASGSASVSAGKISIRAAVEVIFSII